MPHPPRRSVRLLVVLVVSLIVLAVASCGVSGSSSENTVRVYSGRHYDLESAFDEFTEETGIKVEFLFGNDAELRERIKAEGEDTQADVYMTVDAGNLADRRRAGPASSR